VLDATNRLNAMQCAYCGRTISNRSLLALVGKRHFNDGIIVPVHKFHKKLYQDKAYVVGNQEDYDGKT